MNNIQYIKGDATNPKGNGKKLIIHVCNNIGGWGKGFVLAISKKWTQPEIEYRKWHKSKKKFQLGYIQAVKVEKNVAVVNMIAQHDIKTINGVPPIRYEAIQQCLTKVENLAQKYQASIHAPQFGAGLAGGKWEIIENIIDETLCKKNIPVNVYLWK